jgi:RNA polymerase sigma-70 factor (ECF subfamily)
MSTELNCPSSDRLAPSSAASSPSPSPLDAVRNGFTATHWTTVIAAGAPNSPGADAAFDRLCRAYRYPLYAYVRRRGFSKPDAEDLTQSFLASLLHRRSLRSVARSKGRFRTFLLAGLNHFLADEWDKASALKRGGGQVLISLEEEAAEGRYQSEPATTLSPDQLFDRRWALTVLDAALVRLREEHGANPAQFSKLQRFLCEMPETGAYEQAGVELSLAPGAVRVAVHRLRQRYRELVRLEIAGTVSSFSEVEDELSVLLQAIRAG